MAAAAIAAKAAINRKIAKQKAAQLAADLAAGLDPEEEFMKRVMKRMEEEKKAKLTKWQDPTQWTGKAHSYVKFANRMQDLAEGDRFNLFIIGIICAAGIVVGFQTYASFDRVYFCDVGTQIPTSIQARFDRCFDEIGREENKPFDAWCDLHGVNLTDTDNTLKTPELVANFCEIPEGRFGAAHVTGDPGYLIIETIDYVILGIFGFEVFVKIFAEGMAPWNYWLGAEWKWNNFDFFIVVLCLPVWGDTFGGSSVALLRLMRLMRVMKLVKKIPQLQMIVMGLIGGMKSIAYILLLLMIVFYLFAIMGIYAFGLNDAYHFGNLTRAIFSLFRASTLEDWTDIMYINIFGCGGYEYDSGIYAYKELGRSGVKWDDGCDVICDRDAPNMVISVFYWHFFIIISALVMLSLFIGAVTMSMTESMEEMKNEAKEAQKAKQIQKARRKAQKAAEAKLAKERAQAALDNGGVHPDDEAKEGSDEASPQPKPKLSPLKRIMSFRSTKGTSPTAALTTPREEVKMKVVLLHAWEGIEILDLLAIQDKEVSRMCKCAQYYWEISKVAERTANASWFVNMITLVIICAGIMVGIQTEINENNRNYASCHTGFNQQSQTECSGYQEQYEIEYNESVARRATAGGYNLDDECGVHDTYIVCPDGCYDKSTPILVLETLDSIILAIFTVEVLIKTVGKFDRPWYYFWQPNTGVDKWNTFDFVVVAGSFLPGSGSLLTILRLLRLLRVLKLLKAFPALQVIVVALISGLGSIGYIGLILILVFYIFGILAMILYKANDPWHFGTVMTSMLSLFRAATLEDWTDIMYTNVYGCANYGAYTMCSDASEANRKAAMRYEETALRLEGASGLLTGQLKKNMELRIETLRVDAQNWWDHANVTGYCGEAIDLGYTPYCCCEEHSYASGIQAYIYFTVFTILGALVLMTLFIGVITTSMEEAQEANDKEREDEETVKGIVAEAGWGPKMVHQYQLCFEMLDVDGGGTIDQDELRDGLERIGRAPSEEKLVEMMESADLDNEAGLDFPSFVRLMVNINTERTKENGGDVEGGSGGVGSGDMEKQEPQNEESSKAEKSEEPSKMQAEQTPLGVSDRIEEPQPMPIPQAGPGSPYVVEMTPQINQ